MTDATASPPDENLPDPGPVAETSEDVGLAILTAVHTALKETKKAFVDLTENQQEMLLRRLEVAIKEEVRRGFALMLASDFPNSEATLDKVEFTPKGVKGTLSLAAHSEYRHALADHAGRPVLVLMASTEKFLQRMGELRGEKDQRALFAPGETLEFGGERHPPQDPFDDEADDDTATADGSGDAPPHDDPYPGEHTRETVLAMLEIAGITNCDRADASSWDQDTRALVIDWAGAVALRATHAEVHMPPMPAVLVDDDEDEEEPQP